MTCGCAGDSGGGEYCTTWLPPDHQSGHPKSPPKKVCPKGCRPPKPWAWKWWAAKIGRRTIDCRWNPFTTRPDGATCIKPPEKPWKPPAKPPLKPPPPKPRASTCDDIASIPNNRAENQRARMVRSLATPLHLRPLKGDYSSPDADYPLLNTGVPCRVELTRFGGHPSICVRGVHGMFGCSTRAFLRRLRFGGSAITVSGRRVSTRKKWEGRLPTVKTDPAGSTQCRSSMPRSLSVPSHYVCRVRSFRPLHHQPPLFATWRGELCFAWRFQWPVAGGG